MLNSSVGPTVQRVHGVSRFHATLQSSVSRFTGAVLPLVYAHGNALPSGSM